MTTSGAYQTSMHARSEEAVEASKICLLATYYHVMIQCSMSSITGMESNMTCRANFQHIVFKAVIMFVF